MSVIRRRMTAALATALLFVSSMSIVAGAGQRGADANDASGPPPSTAVAIATDRAIRQFEQRVVENARDYLSYTILGQLQARRARESGDFDAYGRAEDAFRKALNVNKDHVAAMVGLAAALASQHRFAEALQMVRTIQQVSPGSVDALIIRGDALVEIGNYSEAEAALDDLQVKLPDEPSVLARLAHLAELKGKHGQALQFLERAAAKEVVEEGNGETAAWYHTRIGSLHFRIGKLDEAAKSFETALRLYDGYYIALDGLADVRAAQGRLDEAIGLLERAVASVPQPASLFALADMYTNSGRAADARRVSQQAESIAQRPGSYQAAYRRELAMFYATGDRDVKRSLDLARQDLEIRRDIHGYDTLAWALYKNQRFDQAAEAMMKALALGTQDATLFAHAGLIEYRRGHSSQAVAYLRSANALAPYLLDAEAGRVLADLSRGPQTR